MSWHQPCIANSEKADRGVQGREDMQQDRFGAPPGGGWNGADGAVAAAAVVSLAQWLSTSGGIRCKNVNWAACENADSWPVAPEF